MLSGIPVSEEPWTFGSAAGRVLSTPSYRVFTTVEPGFVSDRLPAFVEHALARYRTAFASLLPPPHPLDTYILANRPQWSRAAAQMLGQSGTPYQQIIRGGITVNGRSILYDIGPRDTFSLVAHEGWHQYTQSTFREPLPIWLEEGIATVMEGFRWSAGGAPAPEFLPWCNLERFDHLRDAAMRGTLLPLDQVLAGSPATALEGGSDPALTYYAQVWALTLFLMEGDGGRYRAALADLVADAQHRRVSARIQAHRNSIPDPGPAPPRTSVWLFAVYFDPDGTRAADDYREFCFTICVPGAREAVSLGQSPLRATGQK